jgi:hypothetical protein
MSNIKYEITGTHKVCGHNPGDKVTADQLAGADIQHLIDGGHLQPIANKTPPAVKGEVADQEED